MDDVRGAAPRANGYDEEAGEVDDKRAREGAAGVALQAGKCVDGDVGVSEGGRGDAAEERAIWGIRDIRGDCE